MPRFPRLEPLTAALVATWAVACGGPVSQAPPADDRPVLALDRDVPFAVLELPETARPHAPDPGPAIPLSGWTRGKDPGTWQTGLPVRSRSLHHSRPAPGMAVHDPEGEPIPSRYVTVQGQQASRMWGSDDSTLTLYGVATRPADGAWTFRWPTAVEREARLNPGASGLDGGSFVRATVQLGRNNEISRTGLLLPAPGRIAWDVTPPEGGELRLDLGLVAPEWLDAAASDGADVRITWTPKGGQATVVHAGRVDQPVLEPLRFDLSPWAGTAGRLEVQTAPGASPRFDYVFLADPVIAPARAVPRRVFLVFIDTLRPDHLGAWGYPRDTSPTMDRLAANGVRFSNARSVAPWTLPSARTMVTGRHPERYTHTETTLPARLREHGFATAMFAGNMYLGPNFDMNRGWGEHHIDLLPPADAQLDRALAWLDRQPGRDVFMLLHLMDPHLPYSEPVSYMRRFQTVPRPPELRRRTFHLPAVKYARFTEPHQWRYLTDRYDANIRYADDQLARLVERLEPTDVLILVSDHGEEFGEHGDFEHGHTLYDELLRVPFVMTGGGLPVGVVRDDPVSLLDLAPTILDLLDLPADDLEMDGTSLMPVVSGEPEAAAALSRRPLGVGRPLYGPERWGVIDGVYKYTTHAGQEEIYDLAADPRETHDLRPRRPQLPAELRQRMADGLDRPVTVALRLTNFDQMRVMNDLTIEARIPGGVEKVWLGDDPGRHSRACPSLSPDGELLTMKWLAPWRGARELFVVPRRPVQEILPGLELLAYAGGSTMSPTVPDDQPTTPGDKGTATRGTVGGRRFAVGVAVVPEPVDDMTDIDAYDAETAAGLVAMGYAVGSDTPDIEVPEGCE